MRTWCTLQWVLLSAMVLGSSASADEILQSLPEKKLYAIGLTPPKTFKADDLVCVFVDDVKVACGDVFKAAGKGILLFVTDGTTKVKPGTQVEVKYQIANPKSRTISGGINFIFPQLHFQQHATARLAYGFMGEGVIYSRGGIKAKGIIALMTLSYYGKHLFQGPWIMAGAGIHFLNIQPVSATSETENRTGVTSFVGQLNLGWRFRIDRVSIGVAVGAQYWPDKTLRPLTLKEVPGVVPSAILDVGFMF